jgi:subtilisin family serine protease
MATRRPRTTTSQQQRPLGLVMRFAPQAANAGVQQLEAGGVRVARSSDFRSARAVPRDFNGADAHYFERFGLVVVVNGSDRVQRVIDRKLVQGMRDERRYRALGGPRAPAQPGDESAPSRDYLRGYRDAVDDMTRRLLDESGSGPGRLDESEFTWGLQAAGVPSAALSGAAIKVAVLDTGFDETHPDFRGREVVKKLFASDSTEGDVQGHGTHCIGTACGALRPASGPRYGIAHEALICAGKVLGDDGFGTDRSIIAGMEWALDEGCAVISMSLGATTQVGDAPNDDYERIGQVCLDAGTLVVAAAGNDSARPGRIAPVASPANASTVMAVGAIDNALAIAPFSCGGVNEGQAVDLAAPGVDVLSSLPGGAYARWDGTSMATPHVAGIAALVAQSDAKYRGWALWTRLMQLARRLDLPARDVGDGLVQVPR